MSDSTVIALRVEKEIADLIRGWAKAENRTIANFMTNLVNREFNLREGQVVNLESLGLRVDQMNEKIDRVACMVSQLNPKRQKKNTNEPSVFDMDFENNPEVVSEESWKAWIIHLRKLGGVRVNYYFASNQFNQLVQLYNDENWDCDALIDYLIQHNQKSIFVPNDWRRKEK